MASLPEKSDLLGIVGPCSAGKSTLIKYLEAQGYICRHIAQEHSYVPDMWQRIVNPRFLVYLDVSYEVSMQRRKLNLTVKEFEEQLRRLSHARQNAQIYVNTDLLSPAEVQHLVSDALEDLEIET